MKADFIGKKVYEWEQTLEEIHIYIDPPKIVLSKYKDDFIKQGI